MTHTRARHILTASVAAVVIASAALGSILIAASQGRGAASSAIKLYVFDGGTLESDPARYRLTKEDVGTTQLSIGAYLIVHPNGVLMWDTNAVPDGDWTPTGSAMKQRIVLPDGQERFVTLRSSLRAQLTASGYKPEEVTHLALSHMHWDHTANANAFTRATWLVRKIERDAMFVEKPVGAVRPATYSSLENAQTVIITDDEYDVFADGTVVLKAAPGHTPGHQVLYVKLARTGGVVLSGDLYHYPQERTMQRLPVFEFNEEQTRAARKDVDAFIATKAAKLWIQHDFVADAKLRKAPAYYD